MPLNKLDNFIKNTEGRILYVSPSDLDATDSIDNTGNSLARPFKTIQRALIESARFSYVKGNSNDLIEKTTILLMPGEHLVDNRPGFKIKSTGGGQATVVSPSGAESASGVTLKLDLNTNFDLTQENNVLYKFNSTEGGTIVPRGTSIVGLDLRKTKIRPLYVPNPTDDNVGSSAIFRITGTCYFWQFSIFDGNEAGTVYTDPTDFSTNNKSKPIFSHHKLTCFEYADGVNDISGYDLTDLDMYYAKLSNAYGTGSGSPNRNIDSKYPENPDGFAKQRPEWEIVGAFAADPISIVDIESGSGGTPSNQVTVTTNIDHNLTAGTPIKIRGVSVEDYNISTKVQNVDPSNPKVFTYLLPSFRPNLPAQPDETGATVTIETDTVSGASPYIFNISMRSVYGMNGMHADGSKASGFRSMVVAQFTGVSLQKDDRAFVKYDKTNRSYGGIPYVKTTGAELSNKSSATNPAQVYHLDPDAIYRSGWEQTHIRISNDAILQIVSVFAIGYNKHFSCESGGDASITNSNSNFGQLSLISDGFKKEAFDKDNKAFITNVIPPRANTISEENIDWLTIDVGVTISAGISTHLYLRGFTSSDDVPPVLTQGYRVGAKVNDKLYVNVGSGTSEANILMENGIDNSFREFSVTAVENSKLTIGLNHGLKTGESVILISDTADYPENITPHTSYYVISLANSSVTADRSKILLAPTKTDADNGNNIVLYYGSNLRVISRVTDKNAGDAGHPVQFDENRNRWFITVNSNNGIYSTLNTLGVGVIGEETDPTFIKRIPDIRSIDEKIYKFRVVVPKELPNAKTPESGFIIQESSSTGVRDQNDFTLSLFPTSTNAEYDFNKNPRFIATCTHTSSTSSVRAELPHNLEVGDQIIIRNVTDGTNTSASFNSGYNGTFIVSSVPNNLEFTYQNTQSPGSSSTNNTNIRNEGLPRFERNDLKNNFYIYRNEIISEYVDGQKDGVYHIYVLKSDANITQEFTNLSYSQNVTDLYPQLDRDNIDDSPGSSKTKALLYPIGDVHTSNLKESITRETADNFITKLNYNLTVNSASNLSVGIQTVTFTKNHNFNGIVRGTISNQGTGYNPGTYYNVKLLNGSQTGTWRGATAKVVVNGTGNIVSAQIISPGSGYGAGNLYFDQTVVGTGSNALFAITTSDMKVSVGDYVQFTGIGTIRDSYNIINSVPGTNQISIAKTSGDPIITSGHIAIHVGTAVSVNSSPFSSGITTFNCSSPHGLVAGNKFRVLDVNNNNIGDFIVRSRVGVNTFEAITSSQLTTPKHILRHYFSSNSGSSDRSDENLARRGQTFYDGDSLRISNGGAEIGISTTLIPVSHSTSGIGTTERFPIGTYIQVDDEIMRVSSSSLTGTNRLSVVRGVLSSQSTPHDDGSLIRKIRPIPVEFRRPSIIRASGHTFEYLGYGPGNYSTGLPQVQTKTLTEREEFLSQSQERSAGIVVYTGMNNRGDFYIGNTKKSSATGEETSFDTPIPTVAGEDPARLSAIFDEVTIKERIVVEGGDSGEILSQFDGPVTFNNDVRIKDSLSVTGRVRILNDSESSSLNSGSLTINGGVGISKNVNIGGSVFLFDDKKLNFGNNNDLTIYHNGNNSVIHNVGVGTLYIDSGSDVTISEDNVTARRARFIQDGAVELYYNGNKKFETTASGVDIDGDLTITGSIDVDSATLNSVSISSLTNNRVLIAGASGVVEDDANLTFNGTKLGIGATTESTSASTGALVVDGGVGVAKDVYIGQDLHLLDDRSAYFGNSDDLRIYHNSLNNSTYIEESGSGGLVFKSNEYRFRNAADTEEIIKAVQNGQIELFYNNSKKFETTNTGCAITGELTVSDDITAFWTSDERLKNNITPIVDPLAKVLSISGNTFDWNEKSNKTGHDVGLIAQEIQEILPEAVVERDSGYLAVDYHKVVPLLVEAIKELSGKVEALEQKLQDK